METIGFDLRQMQRTPLLPAHITAIRAAGTRRVIATGAFLLLPGDAIDRFTLVDQGEIEVVDPQSGERLLSATLGPGQYAGDIAFLSGGTWTTALRAVGETTVIDVERSAMLALMARVPELSDIVIATFAARRRRQLDEGEGGLRLIGEESDVDVRSVAEFASRNRIPYQSMALGSSDAKSTADVCGIAPARPAVIFGKDRVITDPTRPQCIIGTQIYGSVLQLNRAAWLVNERQKSWGVLTVCK